MLPSLILCNSSRNSIHISFINSKINILRYSKPLNKYIDTSHPETVEEVILIFFSKLTFYQKP
jgi:hypothetical protein